MTLLRQIAGVVCGIAALSCMLACGTINQVKQAAADAQEIQPLGQAYRDYANDPKNKGKGPPNATEWEKWAKASTNHSGNVSRIQQCQPGKKYTFYWNVNISKLTSPATTVLGYDSKLPGAMGVVVMADGNVTAMQPAQFSAATKPPKDDGKAEDKDKDKDKK